MLIPFPKMCFMSCEQMAFRDFNCINFNFFDILNNNFLNAFLTIPCSVFRTFCAFSLVDKLAFLTLRTCVICAIISRLCLIWWGSLIRRCGWLSLIRWLGLIVVWGWLSRILFRDSFILFVFFTLYFDLIKNLFICLCESIDYTNRTIPMTVFWTFDASSLKILLSFRAALAIFWGLTEYDRIVFCRIDRNRNSCDRLQSWIVWA